jgi:hypothetical protein
VYPLVTADVLVLDGEQLIGAQQNRMTNRSILLPAAAETRIPVSCMEQGRWRFVSDEFSPSPQHSPSGARRRARESEAQYAAMDTAAPPEALSQAQSGVWSSIAEKAPTLRACSDWSLEHPSTSKRVIRAAWRVNRKGVRGVSAER